MRKGAHHELADLLRRRCVDRHPWYERLTRERGGGSLAGLARVAKGSPLPTQESSLPEHHVR